MSEILFTPEMKNASAAYEKKFGKELPSGYYYDLLPDDFVEFVNKCISENKPAPPNEINPEINY